MRFFAVGRQTHHTAIGKCRDSPNHDVHHFVDIVRNNRHHHVELELASLGSQGHSVITPLHMEAGHVEHFGQHRVDFAGHDARAGLNRRQA